MKTNWIRTVNDINKKRFTIPEGWETKDEVAASLQCDPDKVSELLKPGLATGDIDKQEFPVWDEKRRLAVRVMCYRLADKSAPPPDKSTKPGKPASGRSKSLDDRIASAIGRHPHKSNREIAKMVFGARSADVEVVRAAL